MLENPKLFSLVFCEAFSRNENLNSITLHGVYSRVICDKFPFQIEEPCFYMRVFGLEVGDWLCVSVDHADGKSSAGKLRMLIDDHFPFDSTRTAVACLTIPRLRFPKPGTYIVRISIGEKTISETPLDVIHTPLTGRTGR